MDFHGSPMRQATGVLAPAAGAAGTASRTSWAARAVVASIVAALCAVWMLILVAMMPAPAQARSKTGITGCHTQLNGTHPEEIMLMHDDRQKLYIENCMHEGSRATVVLRCAARAALIGLLAATGVHSEGMGQEAGAGAAQAVRAEPVNSKSSAMSAAAGSAEQRAVLLDTSPGGVGFLIGEAHANERRTVPVDDETLLRRASDWH